MEHDTKLVTYSYTCNHGQRLGEDLNTQNHSITPALQVSGAPFPGGITHPSAEATLADAGAVVLVP